MINLIFLTAIALANHSDCQLIMGDRNPELRFFLSDAGAGLSDSNIKTFAFFTRSQLKRQAPFKDYKLAFYLEHQEGCSMFPGRQNVRFNFMKLPERSEGGAYPGF